MYPTPIRSERYADAAMHAIGLTGAVIGAVWLLLHPGSFGDQQFALLIYAAALIFTFAASAIYHLAPWHDRRDIFHRFDHAGIYLKIAGTYTPLVMLVGSTFAYLVLAVVWTISALGAVMVFRWAKPSRFGPGMYLALGWLSVLLIWSLWAVLPTSSMVLIAMGGVLYTAGVPFFISKRAYTTAIWHGFVVGASACLWSAIAIGSAAVA